MKQEAIFGQTNNYISWRIFLQTLLHVWTSITKAANIEKLLPTLQIFFLNIFSWILVQILYELVILRPSLLYYLCCVLILSTKGGTRPYNRILRNFSFYLLWKFLTEIWKSSKQYIFVLIEMPDLEFQSRLHVS